MKGQLSQYSVNSNTFKTEIIPWNEITRIHTHKHTTGMSLYIHVCVYMYYTFTYFVGIYMFI